MIGSPRSSAMLPLMALLLQACGGKPVIVELPPKLALTLAVSAAPDINPDLSGRPSPVALALFQLKSAESFTSADFFDLYSPASEALGADVVSREQVTIQPGESRVLNIEVATDTRFLGIAAAYRDIEQADWRAILPLNTIPVRGGKKQVVSAALQLAGRAVTVAVVEN